MDNLNILGFIGNSNVSEINRKSKCVKNLLGNPNIPRFIGQFKYTIIHRVIMVCQYLSNFDAWELLDSLIYHKLLDNLNISKINGKFKCANICWVI